MTKTEPRFFLRSPSGMMIEARADAQDDDLCPIYVHKRHYDALTAERDALRAAITDALGRYQVTHIHEGLRATLNNLTPRDETAV